MTKNHHDATKGGIYTPTEEIQWENLISFPVYTKALMKSLSVGACGADSQSCSDPPTIGARPYNLDSLIPKLPSLDIMSQIDNWIHQYGDYLACLVLLIYLGQALIYLLTIATTMIRDGPAAGTALCCLLVCRQNNDYQKIRRRNKKNQPQPLPEEVPLNQARGIFA